jgi:hypothetical protein
MRYIRFFLIILFFTSCIDQPDNVNDYTFELEKIAPKFKYSNRSSFEMDSISWNERSSHYNRLTQQDFYSIHQDPNKEYLGTHPLSVDQEYYYSIQKRNSKFHEITVLWQLENEYCQGITYFIFSKKGKLIDQFPVAGSCGDGGFFDEKKGRFINDSTYQLIVIDNYKTPDITEPTILTTTEKTYRIDQDGKVNLTEKVIEVKTIE